MRIQDRINERLNERKWYHRATALTLVFSLLCAFFVPLELVKPGFAATEDGYEEYDESMEQMYLAGGIRLLESAPETDVIASDGSFKSSVGDDNANVSRDDDGNITSVVIDGKAADDLGVDGKITSVIITDGVTTYTDSPIDINLGSAEDGEFTLYLQYKYTKEQAQVLTDDNGSPFIYLQIPDNITINSDVYGSGKTAWVIDPAYSGSKPSGYFSLDKDSNLLVIRFTEDYIRDKIKKSGGFSGEVFFSGRVERDETVDGDQSFTIGSTEVNIKFDDKPSTINKSSSIQRDENGNKYIKWTVTITNPDGLTDFNGYLLSDVLKTNDGETELSTTLDLSKVENLSVIIDGVDQTSEILSNKNPENGVGPRGNRIVDGKLLFDTATDDGTPIPNKPQQVTITYTTDAVTGLNENTASFGEDGTTPISHKSTENISNKITVSKSGNPDYRESGGYNNTITWKINVKDQAGDSLGTSKVQDPMLVNIASSEVTVKDKATGAVLTAGVDYKVDSTRGIIEFLDGSPSDVDVIYTKEFDPTKVPDSDITTLSNGMKKYRIENTAKLIPGEDKTTDNPDASTSVDYVTGYTADKNGYYDADTGLINWSITVHSDYTNEGYVDGSNKTGIDGFKLTDAAFNSIQGDITVSNENVELSRSGDTLEISYADDYTGEPIKSVTLTYSTPYDYNMTETEKENFRNGDQVIVKNDVSVKPNDTDKNTTTSNTTVQSRRSVSKSLQESSSGSINEYTFTNDAENRILTWVSELIDDSGFSTDLSYFDSLLATGDGEHYITESQAGFEKVTLEAKNSSSDEYTPITNNYAVYYYSLDDLNEDGSLKDPNNAGKSHSQFFTSSDSKAYAFRVEFTPGGQVTGKKYLRITYNTTADISSVGLGDDGDPFAATSQFTNIGHYGNDSTGGPYTFERKDKDNPDKTSLRIHKSWNDDNNLYGDRPATITIALYRSTDRTNWGEAIGTYVVEAENGWDLEIPDLPQWDENGELDDSGNPVHFYYKAVEFDVPDGYAMTSVNNGVYADSNNISSILVNSTTKTALKLTKYWVDNNAVSKRPETVTVDIYRRVQGTESWGTVYKTVTLSSDDNGNWGTVVPLERFVDNDESNGIYEYRIAEETVEGYRVSYHGGTDYIAATAKNISLGMTNTLNRTDLTVDKQWDDVDDVFGKRPSEIFFIVEQKLGEDGTWQRYGDEVYSIRPNARKRWTTTVTNLPASEEDTLYYYRVVEGTYEGGVFTKQNIAGYEASYSDNDGVASDKLNINETIINTATDKYVKYPINQVGERAGAARLSSIPTISKDGIEYYLFRWEINLVNFDLNYASSSELARGGQFFAIFSDKLPENSLFVNETNFPSSDENSVSDYYPKLVRNEENGSEYEATLSPKIDYGHFDSNDGYWFEEDGSLSIFLSKGKDWRKVKYYTAIPVENFNEDSITNNIKLNDFEDSFTEVEREIIDDIVEIPDKHAMNKEYTEGVAGVLVYNIDFNAQSDILGDGTSIDITDLLTVTENAQNNPNVKFYLKDFLVTDAETGAVVSNASYRVESNKVDRTSLSVEEFEDTLTPTTSPRMWRVSGLNSGDSIQITLYGEANATLPQNLNIDFFDRVTTYYNARYDSNVCKSQEAVPRGDNVFDENGEYTFTITVPNGAVNAVVSSADKTAVTGVSAIETDDYAQKLYINVPDGRHLNIYYEVGVSGVNYKYNEDHTTNSNVDKIVVRNEASFNTGSSQSSSVSENNELNVDNANASSSTNEYPELYKADVGNQEINDLNAKFLISYWDGNKWIYASKIEEVASDNENPDNLDLWNVEFNDSTLTDSTANGNHYYPENAAVLTISKSNAHMIDLTPDKVYRFIEIEGPDSGGYQQPIWEDTVNDTKVRIPLEDNPEFVYYFSYANPTNVPNDVDPDKIKIVAEKSKINILNSKKVNIIADKTFVGTETPTNAKITYKLYWSYDKSSSLPKSAEEVKAGTFGTSSTRVLNYDVSDSRDKTTTVTWSNLPTGIEGKAVYYYVVEQSYTIDGITYDVTSGEGSYSPVYSGNGTDGIDSNDYARNGSVNATVNVANTEGVVVKKIWRNSDGSEMDPSLIPSGTEIKFKLYGNIKAVGNEDGWQEISVPSGIVLKSGNDWTYVVPEDKRFTTIEDDGETIKVPYRAYKVEEVISDEELASLRMSWKGGQLNSCNGVVYLVNTKDRTPTSAVVTKSWDDDYLVDHSGDSVTVQLYVTRRDDLSDSELEQLNQGVIPSGMVAVSDIANLPKPTGQTGDMVDEVKNFVLTEEYNGYASDTVVLNTTNGWSANWKNLPGEIDPLKPGENRLYYYAVELSAVDKNGKSLLPLSDGTTIEHGQYTSQLDYSDHTSAQYSFITNKSVERGNLNVVKHMVDDDSDSDNRPDSITFNIYRIFVPNQAPDPDPDQDQDTNPDSGGGTQILSVLPVSNKTTSGLSASSVRRLLAARNASSVLAAPRKAAANKDSNGNTYYEENGETYYLFSGPLNYNTYIIPTLSTGESFTKLEVVGGGDATIYWGTPKYSWGGGADTSNAAATMSGQTGVYEIPSVTLTEEQNQIFYSGGYFADGYLKLYFSSQFMVETPTETNHDIVIGSSLNIIANKVSPYYTVTGDAVSVSYDSDDSKNLVVTANHAGQATVKVESSNGANDGRTFTITVHALELEGQQGNKVSIGALQGTQGTTTIQANYIAANGTLSVQRTSGTSANASVGDNAIVISYTDDAGTSIFEVSDGETTRYIEVIVGPKLEASISESKVKSGETFTIKTNKYIQESVINDSLPDNMYVESYSGNDSDGYQYIIKVNSDAYRPTKYTENITLSSGVDGDDDAELSIDVEMVYTPEKVSPTITTEDNLIDTVTLKYDSTTKQYVLDSENAAKLQNLPVGTADGGVYLYYISEVTGNNGYVQGKTSSDNYYPCQYDGNTGVNLSDDSDHTIVVHNKKTDEEIPDSVTLPESGGRGTRIYYTVGGILLLLSAAGYVTMKRRRWSDG